MLFFYWVTKCRLGWETSVFLALTRVVANTGWFVLAEVRWQVTGGWPSPLSYALPFLSFEDWVGERGLFGFGSVPYPLPSFFWFNPDPWQRTRCPTDPTHFPHYFQRRRGRRPRRCSCSLTLSSVVQVQGWKLPFQLSLVNRLLPPEREPGWSDGARLCDLKERLQVGNGESVKIKITISVLNRLKPSIQ